MNSNEAFKDRLHAALVRSAFGTQKALAVALDVREATVSGWFNGAWPREDQMRGLIDALGVSGHWLLTGEGPMRPDQDDAPIRLRVIGRIADGKISPRILQAVEDLHRREPDAGVPDAVVQWIAGLDRPDANEGGQLIPSG